MEHAIRTAVTRPANAALIVIGLGLSCSSARLDMNNRWRKHQRKGTSSVAETTWSRSSTGSTIALAVHELHEGNIQIEKSVKVTNTFHNGCEEKAEKASNGYVNPNRS